MSLISCLTILVRIGGQNRSSHVENWNKALKKECDNPFGKAKD